MKKRKIGREGLEVPAIGLGCMGMSFAYGKADEAESLRTLGRALELGVNHWDTAEIYGPFTNESLIGKFLRGRRGEVTLATKFAWQFSPDGTRLGLDGSRANLRRAIEGSLRRLQTDHIDLYYLHRADPQIPIEETVGAMAELVREGKVRFLGLSEVGPQTLRRAHATHPISALQSEYSLWETPPRERILPVLRELGIGLVAYSPVGRGFLTGRVQPAEDMPRDDIRRTFPRFQKEHAPANARLVDALRRFAAAQGPCEGKDSANGTKEAIGATVSQLCIAWLLSQGEDIVTIPGTTRVDHLEEDAAAERWVLSPEEMSAVERILDQNPPSGPRLPDGLMKLVQVP